jgi:hypothetical protein
MICIYIGILAGSISSQNIKQSHADRYERVKKVLLNYKYISGHMLVPNKFVVPADDMRWPEEMWGMKLGSAVYKIRRGISYAIKEDLKSMRFD